MENINLGDINPSKTGADKAAAAATPASNGNASGGAKPSSISINFTPVLPAQNKAAAGAGATGQTGAASTTDGKASPAVMKLEVSRDNLNKVSAEAAPVQEKKGFFAGLFGKKSASAAEKPVEKAKPSGAWTGSLDVKRDVGGAVKTNSAEVKVEAKPATQPTPASAEIKLPEIKVGSPTPVATGSATAAPSKTAQPEFFASTALQEKAGVSKLMENITTQKAQLEKPKIEDLLGKKSAILEKSIEQETQLKLKKKLRLAQSMMVASAALVLAVNGFLYYQLNPALDIAGAVNWSFDNNLRNDLFNLNQNLKSVQTDLNKYRYLTGQLYLNQFGYESTRLMDSVAALENAPTAPEKAEIQSVVEEAKNRLPALLDGVKKNLALPVVVETQATRGEEVVDPLMVEQEFQRELKQAINAEKRSVREAGAQSGLDLPVSALSFFDNAAKLVGNSKLTANIKKKTSEGFKADLAQYVENNDAAQRESFRTFIDDLLASTKVNLATISNLRNARVRWSEVINRLEQITAKVNADHNSGKGSSNASSIEYSSLDFNAENGRITLSGVNTTQSGTNREVVTYLLEALEAAPEFKNVSNRSFPVAKITTPSGGVSYSLNFKIDMEVEKGSFSQMNTPIANLSKAVAPVSAPAAESKVPVKRNQ